MKTSLLLLTILSLFTHTLHSQTAMQVEVRRGEWIAALGKALQRAGAR